MGVICRNSITYAEPELKPLICKCCGGKIN